MCVCVCDRSGTVAMYSAFASRRDSYHALVKAIAM